MSDQEALPDEIDMSNPADVAWVKARNDPGIWHEAAIATLAYLGDKHDFLRWLVQQPNMDRATAGWLFLWPQGSRYLRGEQSSFYARIHDSEVVDLLTALCERSERIGFSEDNLGLDQDWERERQACQDVLAKGEVGAGITVPLAIISKPFRAPRHGPSYEIHDGILLSTHFLRSAIPSLFTD